MIYYPGEYITVFYIKICYANIWSQKQISAEGFSKTKKLPAETKTQVRRNKNAGPQKPRRNPRRNPAETPAETPQKPLQKQMTETKSEANNHIKDSNCFHCNPSTRFCSIEKKGCVSSRVNIKDNTRSIGQALHKDGRGRLASLRAVDFPSQSPLETEDFL